MFDCRSAFYGGRRHTFAFDILEGVEIDSYVSALVYPHCLNTESVLPKFNSYGITEMGARLLLDHSTCDDVPVPGCNIQTVLDEWIRKHDLPNAIPQTVVFAPFPLSVLVATFEVLLLPAFLRPHHSSPMANILNSLHDLWTIDVDDEDFASPRSSAKHARLSQRHDAGMARLQNKGEQDGVNLLEGSMLEELTSFLRQLLQRCGDSDADAIREEGKSWITFLKKLRECHSAKEMFQFAWTGHATRGGALKQGVRGRYSAPYLFAVAKVVLNAGLRKDSDAFYSEAGEATHLRALLFRASEMFPPNIKAELREEITKLHVPCSSLCRKLPFRADVSKMLQQRFVHKSMIDEDVLLLPLMDSSQLKSGNVLMSEYYWLSVGEGASDLLMLGEVAVDMKSLPRSEPFREDMVEFSQDLARLISEKTGHHILPVAFLGPRRQHLPHKFAAWVHAYRLESFDWARVNQFFKLMFCMCSDSGTEKMMRRCSTKVSNFYPWWLLTTPAEETHDLGLAVQDPEPNVVEDDVTLDLTHMLGIRGTMHMVQKIHEALIECFQKMTRAKNFLNELTLYFGHPDSLKEFVQDGLLGKGGQDAFATHADAFQTGPPLLKGGRTWGVLTKVLDWFTPSRMGAIATFFPWAEHEADAAPAEGEGEDPRDIGKHRAAISKHVRNFDAWGEIQTFQHGVILAAHMEAYMKACPCHSSAAMKEMPPSWTCPFLGKRAVCLASGDFDVYILRSAAATESLLLRNLLPGTSVPSRHKAVHNFHKMRSIVYVHSAIRCKEYKDFPALAFKIANRDKDIAMVGMCECILLYDSLTPEQRTLLHSKIRDMFFDGADFRNECMEALNNDELKPIAEGGSLQEWRSVCHYIPTLETSVERLHAGISANTRQACNFGPAYMSSTSRRSAINRSTEEPVGCVRMLEAFDKVWNAGKCLQELGMSGHPRLASEFRPDGTIDPKFPSRLAQNIVYRRDPHDQFAKLPDPRASNPGDNNDGGDSGDGDGGAGGGSNDGGDGGESEDHSDGGGDNSDGGDGSAGDGGDDSDGGGGPGGLGPAPKGKRLKAPAKKKQTSVAEQLEMFIKSQMHSHFVKLLAMDELVFCVQMQVPELIFGEAASLERLLYAPLPATASQLQVVQDATGNALRYFAKALNMRSGEAVCSDQGMAVPLALSHDYFSHRKKMVFFKAAHMTPAQLEKQEVDNIVPVFGSKYQVVVEVLPAFAISKEGKAVLLGTSGDHFTVDTMDLLDAARNPSAFRRGAGGHIVYPELLDPGVSMEEIAQRARVLGVLHDAHHFPALHKAIGQCQLGEEPDCELIANTDVRVVSQDVAFAEALVSDGMAVKVSGSDNDNDDLQTYMLNPETLDRCMTTMEGRHGKPLADVAHNEDRPKVMTTIQLAKWLLKEGWEPLELDTKKKKKALGVTPEQVTKPAAKKFYLTMQKDPAQSLNRKYLMCLMLLSMGKLKSEVLHGQSPSYYLEKLQECGYAKKSQTKGLKFAALKRKNLMKIKNDIGLDIDPEPPAKKERKATAGSRHPNSFTWGKFKFIYKTAEGKPDAWEVTCPFHKHSFKRGTKCKRTRTFIDEDSCAAQLRMLKWWAWQGVPGINDDVTTRIGHQGLQFCGGDVDDDAICRSPWVSDSD